MGQGTRRLKILFINTWALSPKTEKFLAILVWKLYVKNNCQ